MYMGKEMATIRQFLETGELGPIHPGMSEADLLAILGPPQDESLARRPKTLKYGGLQLTVLSRPNAADRELAHVGLYFGPLAEPIPELVRPTDFNVSSETTLSEMREFLARVNLEESAAVEEEDTIRLTLPSGAQITFDGPKLWSIQFAKRAAAPAKRQIAVSISEDTWTQLKTLAQQSKQSLSELCAEWITSRASEPLTAKEGSLGDERRQPTKPL
jgi:hypothetical protein